MFLRTNVSSSRSSGQDVMSQNGVHQNASTEDSQVDESCSGGEKKSVFLEIPGENNVATGTRQLCSWVLQ